MHAIVTMLQVDNVALWGGLLQLAVLDLIRKVRPLAAVMCTLSPAALRISACWQAVDEHHFARCCRSAGKIQGRRGSTSKSSSRCSRYAHDMLAKTVHQGRLVRSMQRIQEAVRRSAYALLAAMVNKPYIQCTKACSHVSFVAPVHAEQHSIKYFAVHKHGGIEQRRPAVDQTYTSSVTLVILIWV